MPKISNLGAIVDLSIAQATDFGPVSLTFLNPDQTPVNLTGSSLAADLRKNPTSPPLAAFTVVITDAVNGKATLSMPFSITSTLQAANVPNDPAGAYVWDLKWTDSLGDVSRPLYGAVTVWREITP